MVRSLKSVGVAPPMKSIPNWAKTAEVASTTLEVLNPSPTWKRATDVAALAAFTESLNEYLTPVVAGVTRLVVRLKEDEPVVRPNSNAPPVMFTEAPVPAAMALNLVLPGFVTSTKSLTVAEAGVLKFCWKSDVCAFAVLSKAKSPTRVTAAALLFNLL